MTDVPHAKMVVYRQRRDGSVLQDEVVRVHEGVDDLLLTLKEAPGLFSWNWLGPQQCALEQLCTMSSS